MNTQEINRIHTALLEAKNEIQRLRERNKILQDKFEVYETMRDLFRSGWHFSSCMQDDSVVTNINGAIKECETEIINAQQVKPDDAKN